MPVGRPASPEELHRTTVNIPRSLVDFFAGLRISPTEGRIKTGLTHTIVNLLYAERRRLEARARTMGVGAEELTVETAGEIGGDS